MVRLSIPGTIMTVCEWFSWEILTFTTSYLNETSLAAQTFLSSAAVLVWHNPFSAGVALNTRISSLIGSGDLASAKKSAKVNFFLFLSVGVIDMGILYVLLNTIILRFFIHDAAAQSIIHAILPFVVAYEILDAMTCYVQGVARGLGIQRIVGWVSFAVHYLYAVPLAVFLELGSPRLGVKGLWIALGSGLCLLCGVEGVILKGFEWKKAVEEARRRDGEEVDVSAEGDVDV